jgi:hypothetical protein
MPSYFVMLRLDKLIASLNYSYYLIVVVLQMIIPSSCFVMFRAIHICAL